MKRADIFKLAILFVLITGGLTWYFAMGGSDMPVERFREWLLGFGVFAGVVFIALYAIAPVFLIPGSLLSVSAGALFGPLRGSLYVTIGATIGAMLAFYSARYFGQSIQKKLAQAKALRMDAIEKQLEHQGFFIVLLLRLIPLFPYSALNYALGLTMVPARDYFLATMIGIIPGVFAHVYLGSNVFNIGSTEFYIAIGVFAFFIGVPLLLRRRILAWLHKRHDHD